VELDLPIGRLRSVADWLAEKAMGDFPVLAVTFAEPAASLVLVD
jgi:hypothetical protein